jgi:hypothetical protein
MESIPTIEQLVPDLFQRQTAAGGMLRPRQISAAEDICVSPSERLTHHRWWDADYLKTSPKSLHRHASF